ncbi:hypothetical protein MASR2M15_07140 [Anaerolineales bacterium]
MKKIYFISSLLMSLFLSACGATGQTTADAAAAQNLLPQIVGYNRQNADSLTDALTTVGAGAALATGNAPVAAMVGAIDGFFKCMQSTGSVAVMTYVEQNVNILAPKAGVIAVVNQDRVADNLLPCVSGQSRGFSAQAVQVEPCTGSGSFQYLGDTVTYVYAATDPALCSVFQGHFDSVQRNNS